MSVSVIPRLGDVNVNVNTALQCQRTNDVESDLLLQVLRGDEVFDGTAGVVL